jgi:CheY-like chemotaxis protein
MKKHLVFIVDDDADDRESIRDAFLENQHQNEYMFMANGNELLKFLTNNSPKLDTSVILLDLNMPGMGGQDVLKVIKDDEKLKPIPVIIFTTSASEKDKELSYELGANCFVTKPDSYTELCSVTDSIARLWCKSEQPTLN